MPSVKAYIQMEVRGEREGEAVTVYREGGIEWESK